jgi:hypothetical protein
MIYGILYDCLRSNRTSNVPALRRLDSRCREDGLTNLRFDILDEVVTQHLHNHWLLLMLQQRFTTCISLAKVEYGTIFGISGQAVQ